jgi:hypothetical protein
MPSLRVLNGSGDGRITWDSAALDNGDREALNAVREAERIFAEQRRIGALAFRVAPGSVAERVDEFDPRVEETLVVPPMVGG